MAIVLDGTSGITTPDLASGPVAGTTATFTGALSGAAATFSGNVTLGSSVLATPTGSAPSYTCRAWVNFNGTTSPGTIRASGNVSSVARNGTGLYTVNFTTAMPDADFVVAGAATPDDEVGTGVGSRWITLGSGNSHIGRSTTFVRVVVAFATTSYTNGNQVNITIHR